MKIALFEIDEFEKKYLEEVLVGHTVAFFPEPLSQDNISLVKDAEILGVFVYSRVTKDMLEAMPQLKYITTMSTGYDHIDITAAAARNILVSNVPTYGETVVAEHTFALLLALSRHLEESFVRARKGIFNPEGLTGFELRGKTLGVIGIGTIGTHVIEIARGFGMNVLGYARHPDLVLSRRLGFEYADLPIIFQHADILTLHLPYNEHTHHFLDTEQFSQMKDGVIILNTARGGLIHNDALLRALDSGKVSGAGLDVLEEEPMLHEEKQLLSSQFDKEKLQSVLEDHMLCGHPKVVITPHNAFNSREALHTILETTHDNIISFISHSPINLVVPS